MGDNGAGPEPGPAPVARYESIGSGDIRAGEQEHSAVARFDEIVDSVAAPVAELGALGSGAAEAAPVAGLAALTGLGGARPELPRVMRLSELTTPGAPREVRRGRGDPPHRSSAERPPPAPGTITTPRKRRARRTPDRTPDNAPPGPGFGPGPEEELGETPHREIEQPAEPPAYADPVAAAKDICLRLLTARARTRKELAQALRRKGIPDEVSQSVLERFDEVGLIDDAAFAGQWVRSRHTYKGLARRAIAMELRQKGVDDEVAGEALAEVDPAAEEQRAEELVKRKLRSMTVTTPEQKASATRRLVGMLARKGYGAGTAYRVVKQALAEHGVELEELDSAFGDD